MCQGTCLYTCSCIACSANTPDYRREVQLPWNHRRGGVTEVGRATARRGAAGLDQRADPSYWVGIDIEQLLNPLRSPIALLPRKAWKCAELSNPKDCIVQCIRSPTVFPCFRVGRWSVRFVYLWLISCMVRKYRQFSLHPRTHPKP